jgi:lysine-arginine-ornithine-binding protein
MFLIKVSLLTAALLTAAMVQSAFAKPIIFATEAANPPFNERAPDGSITGFEIDIGMALCKKMNRECKFIAQNWDGMIPGLLVKKYDGIFSSMNITAQRKEQIAFSAPYYQSSASFVAVKGTNIDFADKALGGKVIGTIPGITQCYLQLKYPDAKVRVYDTADAMYSDAVSGRVDAILSDTIQLDYGLLRTERGAGMTFVGKSISDPECFGEGVGVGIRKEDNELRRALNKAILEVRADGTYKAINDKYFAYDAFVRPPTTTEANGARGVPTFTGRETATNDVYSFLPFVISGAYITIGLSLSSVVLATVFGLLGAWAKLSTSRPARAVADFYTTLVRGVPDLVLVMLLYYGGQSLLNKVGEVTGWWRFVEFNQFSAGLLSIGFIFGSYMTETFRGAYLSVPHGEVEAATAFGMNRRLLFFRIIWPQLIRYALPSFTNNWLSLLNSTALVSVIGLEDLVNRAYSAGRATRQPFTFMLMVLVIYLVLTAISDLGLRRLRHRYRAVSNRV